jgi:hypothetical protein
MAEVTNELMYEVLKQLQDRLGAVDRKIDEVKGELQALRTHSMAMQQDTAKYLQYFGASRGPARPYRASPGTDRGELTR